MTTAATEKKLRPPLQKPPHGRRSPVEQAVLKLNIARLSLLLYPPGHKETRKNTGIAHDVISEVLHQQGRFHIELGEASLKANNLELSYQVTAINELAAAISRHDIRTLLFKKGIKAIDLLCLLERLSSQPTEDRFALPIPGIDIEIINYSGYILVRQDAASPPGKMLEPPQRDRGLKRPAARAGLRPSAFNLRKPTREADRINRGITDTKEAMLAYSTLLQDLKEHAALETGTDTEHSLKASYLKTFLYSLNPTLRKQFLSLTLDHAETNSVEELVQLLASLDHYLIFKLLDRANKENREISPSMFRMVQQVISTIEPGEAVDPSEEFDTIDPMEAASSEELHHLFNREKYETYVEQDYDKVLKNLMRCSRETTRIPDGLRLDSQERDLNPSRLETELIRMIVALDPEELETGDLVFFSKFLAQDLNKRLDGRDVHLLMHARARLLRNYRIHPEPAVREPTEWAIDAFMKPVFLSQAMEAIIDPALYPEKKRGMRRFLTSLGPGILSEIIPWCCRQTDLHLKQEIHQLIKRMSAAAAQEILRQSRSSNPFYLKNLVCLLGFCRSRDALPVLEHLHKTATDDVGIEALKTMITHGSASARDTLFDLLKTTDNPLFYRAVRAAADLKLSPAVPQLTSLLAAAPLSASGTETALFLVQSLGKIGHASAVPTLETILNRSFSLSPKRLLSLKQAIYLSLDGYSPELRLGLLNRGTGEKNPVLRELCTRLIDRKQGDS